jgi:hypothetical protein
MPLHIGDFYYWALSDKGHRLVVLKEEVYSKGLLKMIDRPSVPVVDKHFNTIREVEKAEGRKTLYHLQQNHELVCNNSRSGIRILNITVISNVD